MLCLPQFEPKAAALAESGFDADAPAHALDSFLDNREADARAAISVAVEAEKETENLLLVFGSDADAVVFDPDADPGALVCLVSHSMGEGNLLRPDTDERGHVWSGKFQGIAQQVEEHLVERWLVGQRCRPGPDGFHSRV